MTPQTIGQRDTRQSITESTLKRQVAKPKKKPGGELISRNMEVSKWHSPMRLKR